VKLRVRLSLVSLALALPTIGMLYVVDARARVRAAERLLGRAVVLQLREVGERERCEADPVAWGGRPRPPPREGPPPPHHDHDADAPHGAPPVLYAYSAALEPADANAPAITPALAEQLEHDELATPSAWWPSSDVIVLVRMPWDEGPCARILARGTTTAGWIGAVLPTGTLWLLPLVGMLAGIVLAAGPIVARIVELARRVERSAATGFDTSVALPGRDEIAELSRAFDAAAAEVRKQLAENARRERALREFLANTTHDVMTPLTVLADRLTTLDDQLSCGAAPERAQLTAAMDEVHYVGAILANLALAAKLDAGEPTLVKSHVELDALVERVVSRHRPLARKHAISLELALPELPLRCLADATALAQALGNLVLNALRHNHAGGHVAVLLERLPERRFRVRVLDDGPGIPAAELERLIERGARGNEARTRHPTGQGLGLAIAWRVAALHGFVLALGPGEQGGLQVDLVGSLADADAAG
jgi:signal transduction histidine kinase